MDIPVFPLHAVLFPDGVMPLRIFEARYLEMVKTCVRENSPFAICLIREGREVGQAADFFPVGCLCTIEDWETLPDGLLGVTAVGTQRVKIQNVDVGEKQLQMGVAEILEEDPDQALPDEFLPWAELLQKIITKLGKPFSNKAPRLDSAAWVGSRLTEFLPIDLQTKQRLLEIDHPVVRLVHLTEAAQSIDYYYSSAKL